METGDQIAVDNDTKNGGLNEVSESVAEMKLATPVGPIEKDGEKTNISNKESKLEVTNKTHYSQKGQGKTTSPKNVSVTKNKDGNNGSISSMQPLSPATNQRPSLDHSAQSEENFSSSSLSPTGTGTKPRRTGTLPSYGFTFKCEERAQKRKEFNSKIEEKIHAKEAEKNLLEEKSKENQEAEIKMLRKSMIFKATPLPSFYHEPAPSKVELKKTPPTRARSPKFGRSKRSPTSESEENSDGVSHSGRASLDGRGSRNHAARGMCNQHCDQRPHRQSLPKLASETERTTTAEHDQMRNRKRWMI